MQNRKKALIAGSLAALVAAVVLISAPGFAPGWLDGTDPDRAGSGPEGSNNVDERTHEEGADPGREAPTGKAELEQFLAREPAPLPSSLEGTSVDGGVRADAEGNLIVEARIRRMFEYYLSTLGEADLDTVKTWVAHYLKDNLPASAARQAWSLFRDYLAYRRSLDGIAEPGPNAGPDQLAEVMKQRNALRREKLGAEAAEAFFSAEQAYDEYMLRRRSIQQNDDLSPEEKKRRLEQARAELPQRMREVREEVTEPIRAREKVDQMRSEGASEAEIRAWREAHLGAEAADRLEKLEQRRQQWQQRYEAYRRERRQLDTSGLAEPERQAALKRLRARHFDDDELRRVRALDRIRKEQGGQRPDQ